MTANNTTNNTANNAATSPVDWAEGEEFLKKADARFIPFIEKYGRCTLAPLPPEKYYISLIKAMLSRGLSQEAARVSIAAITGKYGEAPRPEDLITNRFRGLHISGLTSGNAGLRILTEKILEGEVPIESFPEMEDEAIISCLRKVKGLERWTAEMFLVFVMARPDVFPAKDLPLQKGLQEFYGLAAAPKNASVASPLTVCWMPWRTLAAWYLWQDCDERQAAKEKARAEKRELRKRERAQAETAPPKRKKHRRAQNAPAPSRPKIRVWRAKE
ncbi:MAG: hypothetical protein LBP78_01115 [Acidaminococcales bacterium]|jgi:DNA-3-methyladenine glycosylase II|nr:hypothetical protein [Acidaminococcales bacterium]